MRRLHSLGMLAAMELSTFDLNLLLALDRLIATKSVTNAAKELSLTQPAMSRTLSRLRESLSDPVLVRSGRGMVATERAVRLAPLVAKALAAARDVFEQERPFDPKTATGELRIAMGDETQIAFADAILESIWRTAPGIDVRFRRLAIETIGEGRRGTIDLAISPELGALPRSAGAVDLSEFVLKPLYERSFVVVSSPHAHPGKRSWTLRQYAGAQHLLVGPEGSGRGFVDDYLEAAGLTRRVAATVTSFFGGAFLVAKTSLICTLPDEVVRASGVRLNVSQPPIKLPKIPMVLLWHPRDTTDARHRYLREVVADAVQRSFARACKQPSQSSFARACKQPSQRSFARAAKSKR